MEVDNEHCQFVAPLSGDSDARDNTTVLHLAIIGAGLYGIQAARTYLEIHPDHQVTIFEADNSIGGVWSSDRVFDLFTTQTPLRIAEFSDQPLQDISESKSYHGFFPARHVTTYLESYADSHLYAGLSIRSRILTNAKAEKLTKVEIGWKIDVISRRSDDVTSRQQYTASKVIDATGLTSAPNWPSLVGRDKFGGTVLHHRQFAKYYDKICHGGPLDHVIVIGGAKSAADVAYTCARAGKKVSWIIRRNGAGPAAFVGVEGVGPYKNSNESFYTRFTSLFLASIYMDESQTLLGRLLYGSKIGRWLLKRFWAMVDAKAHRNADYEREDGKKNQFQNLKPDTSIFWQQDSTGIAQHPDFFDVIAQKVKVFRDDIVEVQENGVLLADGDYVESNIIVCATGWRTSHPVIVDEKGKNIECELGLAGYPFDPSDIVQEHWLELERKEESNVLDRFPNLSQSPVRQDCLREKSSLRLYKGIIPIHGHGQSIAFLGQMLLGNNFRVAEAQALFAVAALDGTLKLPPLEQMKVEIARHLAWSRLRYLKKGKYGTWLYWDTVPYTDDLLHTIGLSSHLLQSTLKRFFATCFAADLRGLITEYKKKLTISDE